MASFKTHITFGLIIGYILSIVAVFFQFIISPFTPIFIFIATFIGSFLPDLDSDNSTSFNIIFNFISILIGVFLFLFFLLSSKVPFWYWVPIPPIIVLSFRFGFSKFFKNLTKHRGIFHSIPAIFISVLVSIFLLKSFLNLNLNLSFTSIDILFTSLSVGIGYFLHLAIDEICSIYDFQENKFSIKKSLGTALTFTGYSFYTTFFTYILLIILVFFNKEYIFTLYKYFQVNFHA